MWLYYFLALALIIAFHNGMVDAQEGGVRTRYTDAMRNLMASSHDRVKYDPWTYRREEIATNDNVDSNTQGEEKDTGDEGDDDESDENEGDFSNEKEQEDDSDDAEATETSTN
ncbi:hypothetical protein GCK32_002584 [Trichostrongylus colubriformis]|uniref:Uncharacterized protein n=1 Tax=Trichostrongylus colubriformis TaxID=6319 RepID=A0AAN8IU33_TRICO